MTTLTTTTISELTTAAPLQDSFLFAVDTGTYTGSVAASDIKSYLTSGTLATVYGTLGTFTTLGASTLTATTTSAGALTASSLATTGTGYIGGTLTVVGNVIMSSPGYITSSTWNKLNLITGGVTAVARIGSDILGQTITTNALYNEVSSTWKPDTTSQKAYAYVQNLSNNRHEFKIAPTGALSSSSITWSTPVTIDENGLQAVAIGSISPGPAAFTGLTAGTTAVGQLSATALNNTPIGTFGPTTGVFTTLTAGTLNVSAINNTTVGLTTPVAGAFTTLTASSSLISPVIGNSSSVHYGNGANLTSLNASNLASGTVPLSLLSGITHSQLSGSAGITNAQLASSAVTVATSTGLSGGGTVSLGGSITLTNIGVTSLAAGTGISLNATTGGVTVTNSGVTAVYAGTGVGVNENTGGLTVSIGQAVGTGNSPTFTNMYLSGQLVPSAVSNSGGSYWQLGSGAWGGSSPASSGVNSVTGFNYASGSGSQLFTFSSNPGQCSIQMDGSIFVGDGIGYNPLGANGSSDGYLVVANGGSFGGSLYVNGLMYGTAQYAHYGDLAERYLADKEYTPGTVVVFGGDKEITTTNEFADVSVAGVISTDPAFLMNKDLEGGLALALRGRVPVKVVGPVYKGELLVTSSIAGCAMSVGKNKSYGVSIFAKAIETNTSPDEKVIEAVIL